MGVLDNWRGQVWRNVIGCLTVWLATLAVTAQTPPLPGTLDVTFRVEANGDFLRPIAFQPRGKMVVAGNFTSIQGVARRNLARLQADGSLDPTFEVVLNDSPDRIDGCSVNAQSYLLIWGSFTAVNGVPRPGLARLNADGSVDSSYAPEIRDLVVISGFSDGTAFVGQRFSSGRTCCSKLLTKL